MTRDILKDALTTELPCRGRFYKSSIQESELTCDFQVEMGPGLSGSVDGQAREGARVGGTSLEEAEAETVPAPGERDSIPGLRHQMASAEPGNI